jgi:hypothetical protein
MGGESATVAAPSTAKQPAIIESKKIASSNPVCCLKAMRRFSDD